MPFTVEYGPISDAMQLAQGAGAAQRQQIGFGEDMQALGYMQNAQKMAQTQRATEIQQSIQNQGLDIEQQKNIAQNNLANSEMQNNAAYRQGVLGNQSVRNTNTGNYDTGRVQAMQQNADTNQVRAGNTDDFHQMMLGVAQQNASAKQQSVDQQGQNQQATQGQGDLKGLQNYYNSLSSQAKGMEANAAKNFGDASTDPNYQAIKQKMQAVEQSMREALASQGQQKPQVNPQIMKQIQQQGGVNQQQLNAAPQVNATPQQQTPQANPDGSPVAGSRGPIPTEIAAGYLRRLGFNGSNPDPAIMQQAKQMAIAEGWSVPQ